MGRFSTISITAVVAAALTSGLAAAPPQTDTVPAPSVQALLDRAHDMHVRLERIPVAQRRPAQYEAIADVLTQVWKRPENVPPAQDIEPTPAEQALFADGGLHVAMAQDLRDPAGWREAASDYRQLLLRFPGTRFRRNAEWALAQVEWFHLGQREHARRRLADFLRRYPADARADYARRQLRGRRIGPPQILPPSSQEAAGPRPTGTHTAPAPVSAAEPAQRAKPVAAQIPPQVAPGPVAVSGLEWHIEPDGLTLVVTLSGRPEVAQGNVSETHAVYFDFSAAHFAPGMANRFVHLANPLISEIELARNRTGVIRLAVHERPGSHLAAVAMYFPNPARLVISLRPAASPAVRPVAPSDLAHAAPRPELEPAPRRRPPAPRAVARAPQPLASGTPSIARALGLKVRRIVIDAGHGGFDTGAIGPNGLDEKTVTLAVALRLGRLLHDRLGEHIIYTRRSDVFIPLQQRTAIANAAHADLFISIHANSSPDQDVTGVEAYYLNLTRSPRALEVAARENDTSDLGDHDLRVLLKSIAQNDKRRESEALCGDIDQSLAAGLDEANRGVKSAPFIVLIGAEMPSVLAEVSFLSNPHYARLLATHRYQQRIAEALYRGIAEYIRSLGGVEPVQAAAER